MIVFHYIYASYDRVRINRMSQLDRHLFFLCILYDAFFQTDEVFLPQVHPGDFHRQATRMTNQDAADMNQADTEGWGDDQRDIRRIRILKVFPHTWRTPVEPGSAG